jgi:hypothetical protein
MILLLLMILLLTLGAAVLQQKIRSRIRIMSRNRSGDRSD